jgi:hypothetical protein
MHDILNERRTLPAPMILSTCSGRPDVAEDFIGDVGLASKMPNPGFSGHQPTYSCSDSRL